MTHTWGSTTFVLCFCGVIHSANATGRVLFMSRRISVPRHRRESEAVTRPPSAAAEMEEVAGIRKEGGHRLRRRD